MFCFSKRRPPETPDLASMMMSARLDELGVDKRQKRKQRRRWIASWTGDEPRGGDFVAVELGQPIGRARKKLWRGMVATVPLGVTPASLRRKSADMSMTLTLSGSVAMMSCAVP